jgi:hypothetical protein
VFERFTDMARRVVVLAQDESRILNHGYIGTEHILLGLIREGEGVAAKALESLGISLEAVRSQVEEIIGQGQAAPTGHIPFTPRAKKVLELSLREALQLGHTYIGTEHILLGLIREGEGVAAQVLQKLGADFSRVRQQVIQLLQGYADKAKGQPDEPNRPQDPLEVLQEAVRRARRAQVLSEQLALASGDPSLTGVHFLNALLLNRRRMEALERLSERVEENEQSLDWTLTQARRAREFAERLAAASGDPTVKPEEVLHGLLLNPILLVTLETYAREVEAKRLQGSDRPEEGPDGP